MPLYWPDAAAIAAELHRRHPDYDRARADLDDLCLMVTALPDFQDDPLPARETQLYAILWKWQRLAAEVCGEDVFAMAGEG